MAKNKKIIIGNWKMNFTMNESSLYLHKLSNLVQAHRNIDVVLAPSIFTLQSLSLQVNRRQFKLAAQNFYWRDFGSYTGEVSIAQLKGIVDYAIIGHMERRHIFNEADKDIRGKVQAALRSGVKPILCVGETIIDRTNGETRDVINDQLMAGLANITSDDIAECVIVYEPVWAVGTGEIATAAEVQKAIKIVRQQIEYMFGKKAAQVVRVVYGGSVDTNTAFDYLELDGVDGLILGKASLNAYEFSDIIEKTYSLTREGDK
ncbi:MAG: triose-phosphate isomerase [Candidatus Saccharibacteria bacterium]|nr:triose-phosphate isomerase [Candidatus Saccharibacteria bacterium]